MAVTEKLTLPLAVGVPLMVSVLLPLPVKFRPAGRKPGVRLVGRHYKTDGYKRWRLMRALAVVNCQLEFPTNCGHVVKV